MLEQNQIDQVSGTNAYSAQGEKIGKVGELYLDDQSGQPAWVTVNTGFFGTSESFVPVSQATFSDDRLTVPYDNDKIKGAPNVSADGHLSPEEERELYAYYGLSDGYDNVATPNQGYDTSGPTTDNAMTRSEEQLRVGTRTEDSGRARLRKYVATEKVSQTVPVRKEKAVVEHEPITDANISQATAGAEIQENEHEIALFEEEPVVQKTTTPVERVRLGTEVVTENVTVTDEVRKERIEVDGDVSSNDAK